MSFTCLNISMWLPSVYRAILKFLSPAENLSSNGPHLPSNCLFNFLTCYVFKMLNFSQLLPWATHFNSSMAVSETLSILQCSLLPQLWNLRCSPGLMTVQNKHHISQSFMHTGETMFWLEWFELKCHMKELSLLCWNTDIDGLCWKNHLGPWGRSHTWRMADKRDRRSLTHWWS